MYNSRAGNVLDRLNTPGERVEMHKLGICFGYCFAKARSEPERNEDLNIVY